MWKHMSSIMDPSVSNKAGIAVEDTLRAPGSLLFSHPLHREGDIPRAGTFHVLLDGAALQNNPCSGLLQRHQGLPGEQSHVYQTQIKRKRKHTALSSSLFYLPFFSCS